MVKGRFLGACLLLLAAAAAALSDGEEKQGKRGVRLLDAGRLEKFVDELPDMPVLRGYGVAEGGRLVAGELAVGMYDTTWNEEAAGNKRKLDIVGFNDPSDSDDDEEYNSGDEVEEWNHKSFIEKEANKIREKGKAAYYKWGKFRCPYCTTKPIPKDGMYEHLMSHARGLKTSGRDLKIRAEHAALLKAMSPM